MQKNVHDDALLIHLTVNQMKKVIESVIQQSSSFSDNPPEIIGIEEVCILTGYKKASIYKLTHERSIPFHKPAHGGRRVFFRRTEIIQWLQSNRTETNEEFFQNHRVNKKVLIKNKSQIQKDLHVLRNTIIFLSVFFQGLIKKYKNRIQELEEKVSMYEKRNQ